MHLNSELLFSKYAAPFFSKDKAVLEIGPNGYPSYYKKLLKIPDIEWHTLDIGVENIEGGDKNPLHITSSSEYNYPIPAEKFDVVVSGQVMEHVKKIWIWMDELKRITKPGGVIILIVPVSWTYHAAPVDCWRIYPEGMKAIVEDKGLEVIDCRYESLERDLIPKATPTIPGDETINIWRKISSKNKFIFAINKSLSFIPFLTKFRYPVTVAYDTVCICRKIR